MYIILFAAGAAVRRVQGRAGLDAVRCGAVDTDLSRCLAARARPNNRRRTATARPAVRRPLHDKYRTGRAIRLIRSSHPGSFRGSLRL